MKILIPNASSATNIGDQAILLGLLKVVKETWPEGSIVIHATDPNSYKGLLDHTVRETLYSWSVFEHRNIFYRMFRCTQLCIAYFLYRLGIVTIPMQRELRELLDDYRTADIILFTGGGFFRSKAGLTQALNLGMHILMIKFAKVWGSRVIVAPVSFGPFAYKWQEKLTAETLKECTESLMVRESISLEKLAPYKISQAVLSSDLAFLLDGPVPPAEENTHLVIAFTLRTWLKRNRQKRFENEIITVLIDAAAKANVQILPIVQVDALEFGDDDLAITQRIVKELKLAGVEVLDTVNPKTAEQAMAAYAQADILLGMRMHSNILAANMGTPFIPISYEYKTQGIAAQLGILELCIDSEKDSGREVSNALQKVTNGRESYTNLITQKVTKIKQDLSVQLKNILLPSATFSSPAHVTLGIAAYNAAANIENILKALVDQKNKNFVLDKIVVHVDGNGDDTLKIVKQFNNQGVEAIETLPRQGFANAFIKLMKHSSSDVTILFNDDILIEDDRLIEKLIQPFYECPKVGLVCGHPAPLPPVSFVDKAITTSHLAWDTMRMQLRQGHNSFTCDGKIMVMSKEFINKIDIPKDLADMGNVDAYIFLECLRLKFNYRYVREAVVKYRNPITLKEHFAWSIRNNSNQHRYKKKFGSFVKEKYKKPRLLYISSLSRQFFRDPLGALFIFFGGFYVRYMSRRYANKFSKTWSVLSTSKKLS